MPAVKVAARSPFRGRQAIGGHKIPGGREHSASLEKWKIYFQIVEVLYYY